MSVNLESTYQIALEQVLGGTHKKMGIYGVSDITTDELHAEIKNWKYWKNMLAQLLVYNEASFRKDLRAYVFGERPKSYTEDDVNTIVILFKKYGIALYQVSSLSETRISIQDLSTLKISEHKIGVPICEPMQQLGAAEKDEINKAFNSKSTDPVILLDTVVLWLGGNKAELHRTLKRTYKVNIDYTSEKNPVESKSKAKHYVRILITSECFKRLCMVTRTEKSEMVRSYLEVNVIQ